FAHGSAWQPSLFTYFFIPRSSALLRWRFLWVPSPALYLPYLVIRPPLGEFPMKHLCFLPFSSCGNFPISGPLHGEQIRITKKEGLCFYPSHPDTAVKMPFRSCFILAH